MKIEDFHGWELGVGSLKDSIKNYGVFDTHNFLWKGCNCFSEVGYGT